MPDAAKVAMIRQHFPALQARAAAAGIAMAKEHPRLGVDTRKAHEASKFIDAHAPERSAAFHHGIYQAHFVEGRAIDEVTTLLDIARAVGEPSVDELEVALAEHRYREAVLEDQREARQRGITGVPTMFANGRTLSAGYLPPPELLRALDSLG